MSTFKIEVVKVGPVEKHANADSLGITRVGEYPVIVRLGETNEGDLRAYVPVDSVVPPTGPTSFLADPKRRDKPVRIKAKRLRGVFSMGLLIPAPEGSVVGDDVASTLGIVKYEEPEPMTTSGEDEKAPVDLPVFDVEGWRGNPDAFREGEQVEITEKVHGCNARFLWKDGRIWAASRTRFKKESDKSVWWRAVVQCGLTRKLVDSDGYCVYGEVYGQVQDLKYGLGTNQSLFVAFDVLHIASRTWMDAADARLWCAARDIPFVPSLYVGPYSREVVRAFTSGTTIVGNGAHFREGIVIRPTMERYSEALGGRLILKNVSEEYLLRHNGTEHK